MDQSKDKASRRSCSSIPKEWPTSILRIRFKDPVVATDLMRRILVFMEDSGIRIAIPRPGLEPTLTPHQLPEGAFNR